MKNWEKQFDELFITGIGGGLLPYEGKAETKPLVKLYISKLLKAQRKEIIEKINKLSAERDNPKNHPLVSFQDVCEEIKSIIKNLNL